MARNPNGWDCQYCSPFPSRDLDSLRSCCTNSVSNEHSSSYPKDCHLVFILSSKGLQCCTRFDRPVSGLQPRYKLQKRTTQMLESFFTKWPIFATQHTPPAPLNVGPSSIARCVHHCSRTRHWSFLAKIIGMLISGIAASLWTRNLRSHRISKAPTKDRFCFLPRPSHTRLSQTISPSSSAISHARGKSNNRTYATKFSSARQTASAFYLKSGLTAVQIEIVLQGTTILALSRKRWSLPGVGWHGYHNMHAFFAKSLYRLLCVR